MHPLRIAIIGAGHLGRIHTRLAAARTDIELLGIVEPLAETRAKVSAEFSTPGFEDVREIIDRLDAAIVVTPTKHHHAVALPLLKRGIHCFVEKPITLSLADADELIAAARASGAKLQVGHVERFNPALAAARDHVRRPTYIAAARTSTYTCRSIDIGVVLDLMIHDIDIALSLAQSEVVEVHASGAAVFGPHEDIAHAWLEFASGCVAQLTASRVSPLAQRTIQIQTEQGAAHLDLAARTAKHVGISPRVARGEVNVASEQNAIKERLWIDYLPQIDLPVAEANAIADEQTDFFDAIRADRAPIVPGDAGRDALAVAYRVLDAMRPAPRDEQHRLDAAHAIRRPHFATPAEAVAAQPERATRRG